MALRALRIYGDPILGKKAREVTEMTPRIYDLIDDMFETMYASNGVGIAAPQVGVLRRIFVIDAGIKGRLIGEEEPETEEVQEPVCETAEGEAEAADEDEDIEGEATAYVFINPEIIETEGEQTGDEGCLSVPGKCGTVTRPMRVIVRAYDENLEPFELEATGLLARAICHETDHLDGHVYVEKVQGELRDMNYDEEETEAGE
ncbi:MAG: peptide deformylase [Lachnospiraceae bacterium]|nr:peptide deformylase [Lachnospiraceae bacterium]